MNLAELVELVGNKLDYAPGTTGYNAEVVSLINSVYTPFCASAEWEFAQAEVLSTAYADVAFTLGAVTGARNLTAISGAFASWMVGQPIEIGGVEYEIVQVDSATSAWIDAAVTTSVGDAATVKHRYLVLPEDCVEILTVAENAHTTSDPTGYGVLPVLTRGQAAACGDYLRTGTPTLWIPADADVIPPPARMAVLTTTAGTAWAAGIYQFKIGLKSGDQYGPMSSGSVTHTATSTSAVVPRLTFANFAAGSGYQYVVWCLAPNYGAWRLLEDGIAETGGVVALTEPTARWGRVRRAPENGGQTKRIRLYPRPDTDRDYTVRYRRRAPRLVEDQDQPIIPEPAHQLIADLVMADVYRKKGQTTDGRLAEDRAKAIISELRSQHLQTVAKSWVKGSWDTVGQRPYDPFRVRIIGSF